MERVFRLQRGVQYVALAAHTLAAIALYSVLWRCNAWRLTRRTATMLPLDWADWQARGSPGAIDTAQCNGTVACYRDAEPWAEDEPALFLGGSDSWNPVALAVAFEWLSAAFAVFHLRDHARWKPWAWAATAWVGLGFFLLCSWYASEWSGLGEVLLVFTSFACCVNVFWTWDYTVGFFEERFPPGCVAGSAELFFVTGRVWRVPRLSTTLTPAQLAATERLERLLRRLAICLRYIEYACTASLLYLAVLFLLVVGPPSWAPVAGVAGVVACNLFGLALHVLQLEMAEGAGLVTQALDEPAAQEVIPEGKRPYVTRYDLGIHDQLAQAAGDWAAFFGLGKWRSHRTAKLICLQGAWVCLGVALMLVLYLGAGVLSNPGLPWVARAVAWLLLVLYTSFGVVGTVYYLRDAWWPSMELALGVLDLAAKIPIAVLVCVSFEVMPGGSC